MRCSAKGRPVRIQDLGSSNLSRYTRGESWARIQDLGSSRALPLPLRALADSRLLTLTRRGCEHVREVGGGGDGGGAKRSRGEACRSARVRGRLCPAVCDAARGVPRGALRGGHVSGGVSHLASKLSCNLISHLASELICNLTSELASSFVFSFVSELISDLICELARH